MFVNLTDAFTMEDRQITIQGASELTQVTIGGTVYSVQEQTPVELTVTNMGRGKAWIMGRTGITFALPCDRCLRPVTQTLTLHIDREVFAPELAATLPDDADDQRFMDGYQLNVEDLLYNEIIMNWPMKVLCKPDCKGICRQCGRDLNTGTCDCDTFVPDPRMAAIKDIFNRNKEV